MCKGTPRFSLLANDVIVEGLKLLGEKARESSLSLSAANLSATVGMGVGVLICNSGTLRSYTWILTE